MKAKELAALAQTFNRTIDIQQANVFQIFGNLCSSSPTSNGNHPGILELGQGLANNNWIDADTASKDITCQFLFFSLQSQYNQHMSGNGKTAGNLHFLSSLIIFSHYYIPKRV